VAASQPSTAHPCSQAAQRDQHRGDPACLQKPSRQTDLPDQPVHVGNKEQGCEQARGTDRQPCPLVLHSGRRAEPGSRCKTSETQRHSPSSRPGFAARPGYVVPPNDQNSGAIVSSAQLDLNCTTRVLASLTSCARQQPRLGSQTDKKSFLILRQASCAGLVVSSALELCNSCTPSWYLAASSQGYQKCTRRRYSEGY